MSQVKIQGFKDFGQIYNVETLKTRFYLSTCFVHSSHEVPVNLKRNSGFGIVKIKMSPPPKRHQSTYYYTCV